ncbi:MAG: hypothetical protein Q9184_005682 [Pyrenodesmia sp. 2 TL-2023]
MATKRGQRPAKPYPFVETPDPIVDWQSKTEVRRYLKEEWNGNIFTAHGALSAEYPAEAFEFTSYYWLFLAYQRLGMPHSKTEKAFRGHYLVGYLDSYEVGYENYWQEYYEHLEVKVEKKKEGKTKKKTYDAEEKKIVDEWGEWLLAEADRKQEMREMGEIDQDINWRKTLVQDTCDAQLEWDGDADAREERRNFRKLRRKIAEKLKMVAGIEKAMEGMKKRMKAAGDWNPAKEINSDEEGSTLNEEDEEGGLDGEVDNVQAHEQYRKLKGILLKQRKKVACLKREMEAVKIALKTAGNWDPRYEDSEEDASTLAEENSEPEKGVKDSDKMEDLYPESRMAETMQPIGMDAKKALPISESAMTMNHSVARFMF